jgi:hypothetical protein
MRRPAVSRTRRGPAVLRADFTAHWATLFQAGEHGGDGIGVGEERVGELVLLDEVMLLDGPR